MQQPQGVQEQDWEVFQANKNPHLDMQVGIPMPREFPIAAIFLAAVQAHSLGTLFHKPTVKPLAPHSCLPVRDPSSGPGKHCHQPPARSPAAPGTCAQEFSVFLHPENMGLKNVPCQMDIHPLANGESKQESFWDLLQAITCYWPAPRKGEQLAASHFMHNLY